MRISALAAPDAIRFGYAAPLESLEILCRTKEFHKKAYLDHRDRPDSEETLMIAWDIKNKKLMEASIKADRDYETALNFKIEQDGLGE